jgi:MFS family permease
MSSSWIALRNPVFRRLWFATVISGTCMAAHDNAAIYMMNTLAASPFLISFISTMASLSFFLFTLPAGVLADRVNRKKLACVINLWLAAVALALAIVGWLHLLNPCLILISVFLIGIGFAFNAPTWTSIVPQVVSDTELPSASTLSGLQLNLSGIIGPALGGFLVSSAGSNFVFIANAICFLLVILSILQWKQQAIVKNIPSPKASHSWQTVIQYIRCARELQIVLTRNFLFAFFISAIPAVVPVIGLQVLHLNAGNLGLLFTSMGAGSVLAALFIVPWFRVHFSPNTLTLSANLLIIIAYGLMAFVRQTELFMLVAAVAGAGWTISSSELWVAAQRSIPDWARGRLNATVIMMSQGATVIGGVTWGALVVIIGPTSTLATAAVLFLVRLVLGARLSIDFTANLKRWASNVLAMNRRSKKALSTALI